jgi:hypothetical protein
MEEALENGKELPHSAHANGIHEWMNTPNNTILWVVLVVFLWDSQIQISTLTLAVLTEEFLCSLSVSLTSCQGIPLYRPWLLPSTSFTVHYSLIILSPLYSLMYWLCHWNPLNKININLLWIIRNRDFGHINFHKVQSFFCVTHL